VRVLLVTHRYPPDGIGGVERYVERLRAALELAGDDVEVLTRTPRRFPRRPRLVQDAGALRIVGSGVRLREFLVGHDDVERAFAAALERTSPEIVHVNHLIGLSPRIVTLASQAGARVVFSLHDFYAECPLVHLVKTSGELCRGASGGDECAATCFADEGSKAARWRVRYVYFSELLRLVDRVVAPSRALATVAASMARDARIELLPLGVERRGLASPPEQGAPLTLAHLGTLSPHKGVFNVVEALRSARLPAVRLRVHGRIDRTEHRRRLERAAAAVPGVELVVGGDYEPEELPALLDGVHAVVAASDVQEGYPLAPREALAAGVPVVAVALGGLAEVVENEVDGLIVPPRDSAALGSTLARLGQEPELRERLRTGARASQLPSFDDHTAALRGVYHAVLQERRHASTETFEALHRRALEAGFGRRR
jgi:glycosyltransferase involved in cell wall biosynthesis